MKGTLCRYLRNHEFFERLTHSKFHVSHLGGSIEHVLSDFGLLVGDSAVSPIAQLGLQQLVTQSSRFEMLL